MVNDRPVYSENLNKDIFFQSSSNSLCRLLLAGWTDGQTWTGCNYTSKYSNVAIHVTKAMYINFKLANVFYLHNNEIANSNNYATIAQGPVLALEVRQTIMYIINYHR